MLNNENMKFRKNIIKIKLRNFFYWEKGGHKKETIVLLHGFPGNHMGLIDVANNLGSDYRIIVPDFPACGESESLQEKHSLKNYADWLNLFLKSLNIKKGIIRLLVNIGQLTKQIPM